MAATPTQERTGRPHRPAQVYHLAHGAAIIVAEVNRTVFAEPAVLEADARVDAPGVLVVAHERVAVLRDLEECAGGTAERDQQRK